MNTFLLPPNYINLLSLISLLFPQLFLHLHDTPSHYTIFLYSRPFFYSSIDLIATNCPGLLVFWILPAVRLIYSFCFLNYTFFPLQNFTIYHLYSIYIVYPPYGTLETIYTLQIDLNCRAPVGYSGAAAILCVCVGRVKGETPYYSYKLALI